MAYCASRFRTVRRPTREVSVGSVGVGGGNPIRVQSMTTSDTQDVAATVRQSVALAEVGCEIIRVTAPNVQAARCLREIRSGLTAAGWGQVPPGSRNSTYKIPAYQQATAAYAGITQDSVNHANPLQPTVDKVPYTGVQYVSIPEFVQIGDFVSQQVAGAISGALTVDQAMQASQKRVKAIMDDAGYGQ